MAKYFTTTVNTLSKAGRIWAVLRGNTWLNQGDAIKSKIIDVPAKWDREKIKIQT